MERSEQINELATALAKAQGQFRPAIKESAARINSVKGDNASYSYKFADLASVVEACRAPLAENGIAILQMPETIDNGLLRLTTIITHGSGQWMASAIDANFLGADIKKLGSAITYLRRYSYMAMVGIVSEDDDGSDAPPIHDRQGHRGNGSQSHRRTQEMSSREEVNETFKPSKAVDQGGPKPRPTHDKEDVKLRGDKIGAKGKDIRQVFSKIIEEEAGYAVQTCKEYRARHNLNEAKQPATDSPEVTRHMVKAAVAANADDPEPPGPDGKRVRLGIGKLAVWLNNLYDDPQWREWMRGELEEYLARKYHDAIKIADNEIYGDTPSAEKADQEPGQQNPERNGHLVGVGTNDEAWGPGRE